MCHVFELAKLCMLGANQKYKLLHVLLHVALPYQMFCISQVSINLADFLLVHIGSSGSGGGGSGSTTSGSSGGSGSFAYQQQQQQQQQAMQYYNTPMTGGAGMFYSPFGGPMYYNAPILPVDEGTLQDYIRKQM